eukprot:GILI01021444.1.p1 GENE.GILI01021444.1~~GILI01021444.1.p1  ORF type:complete len:320 (+),score=86.29 GILI01021444.1:52-960(+)
MGSSLSSGTHSCLATPDRPAPSPRDPERSSFFRNKQGLWIHSYKWLVPSPKGVIFLCHGFSEHIGRYEHVANAFNAAGFSVLAIDHQGHGHSEGDRTFVSFFQDYIDDFCQFVQEETKNFASSVPRFLLGHSMGGLIAIRVGLSNVIEWKGVVLSAPGVMVDPNAASPAVIKIGRAISKVFPKMGIKPLDLNGLTTDMQMLEAIKNDPLRYDGKVLARWGTEFIAATEQLQANYGVVNFPFLCVHGDRDTICNVEGSRQLHSGASSTDKKLIVYPGMLHECFNEVGRDKVFADIIQWLDAKC